MVGLMGKAFELAHKAHREQGDKSGAPYIGHVLRVATPFYDRPFETTVALLHDIVEDTEVTLGYIELEFGWGVRDAVDAITRRRGEGVEMYLKRVKANRTAELIKRVDIADNLDPYRLGKLRTKEAQRLSKKYSNYLSILNYNRGG